MITDLDIQLALLAKGIGVGKHGADGTMGPDTREGIMEAIRRVPPSLGEMDDARPAPGGMTVSAVGRAKITEREGLRLAAYRDGGGVLTIGVGHTSAAGPPTVTPGMKITAADADNILSRDLATFEKAVRETVKVPLKQHEFDALVSFAFNVGAGAFEDSTLVKKLNAGDRAGAADQLLRWNKDNGKVVPGLTNRRKSERKQFLGL